jgi:fructan beta-fructosidase
MTIPRELVLKTTQSREIRLASIPVTELRALRGKSRKVVDRSISETTGLTIADCMTTGTFEVLVEYELETASEFGLVVGNTRGEKITIGYEVLPPRLFVDRRESGVIGFDPDFAGSRHAVTQIPESDVMRLDIFVDRSSIEVSANDGSVWITDLVFPRGPYDRIELYAKGGDGHLRQAEVWEMDSIWREQTPPLSGG